MCNLPARGTVCAVLQIISSTMIIKCSQRTRLRVTWPWRTVMTSFTDSGCLRSCWTVMTNSTLNTILHKPSSWLIKESTLWTRFLYGAIWANTQTWDSICDVGWTIEARTTVTCLMDGFFKAILPCSTHSTCRYISSFGISVKCTNRTRNFNRVTCKFKVKKQNLYKLQFHESIMKKKLPLIKVKYRKKIVIISNLQDSNVLSGNQWHQRHPSVLLYNTFQLDKAWLCSCLFQL